MESEASTKLSQSEELEIEIQNVWIIMNYQNGEHAERDVLSANNLYILVPPPGELN